MQAADLHIPKRVRLLLITFASTSGTLSSPP
jgi:hypothetical protein